MKKGRIFASYHYLGTYKTSPQVLQGFGNMVGDNIVNGPLNEEEVEDISNDCREACIAELGISGCSVTLLHWKILDGD